MICDFCGSDSAHIRHTSRDYGRGKNIYIIENIPVVTCNNCNESYLTADTLHEIDKLKRKKSTLFTIKEVPVAEFSY